MNTLLKNPGYQIAVGGVAANLRALLAARMAQSYARFCASWECLLPDHYLRDGGKYRLRRYSVFTWQGYQLRQLPHEPHYQGSHYNTLHGGINRHFRAWQATTVSNPVLKTIIDWCIRQFSTNPTQGWRIQAHQFRIIASATQEGRPTPEGVHKDGADYILIMLLNRRNVRGGVSHLYDNHRQPLEQCILQDSGDLLLINDKAVYHGVTPIVPDDPTLPAWRDVLVLTFHRQ